MSTPPAIEVRGRYSFSVYGTIMRNSFDNVTVLVAGMDLSEASATDDVVAMNVAMRPYLPAGTITDPAFMTFYRLRTSTGEKVTIAREWIRMDTVRAITNQRVHVIVNNASPSTAQMVRNLLLENNITDIEISYE